MSISPTISPTLPQGQQMPPYPGPTPYSMPYGTGYPMYHNVQSLYSCPSNPFVLCFIAENISTCFGCKNKYNKSAKPSQDLCVRHQEWRQFTASGTPQSNFGNAYYHCKPECIWLKWPNFSHTDLEVPQEVAENLSQTVSSFRIGILTTN